MLFQVVHLSYVSPFVCLLSTDTPFFLEHLFDKTSIPIMIKFSLMI